MHSASGFPPTVACGRAMFTCEASKRSPEEPVSTSTLSIVWQFAVPGTQMVTLANRISTSSPPAAGGPAFTWTAKTLFTELDAPPLSATLCELGDALSAKPSEADSPAAVDGLNVSVTVQFAPAATWLAVEQVAAVMAKSAAFAPERPGLLEKVSEALPTFIKVTVIGALVGPSGTGPNDRVARRVTAGSGEIGNSRPPPPLAHAARVITPAAR